MNTSVETNSSANDSTPDRRSSGLGTASLILAVVAGVATLAVFAYAGYLDATTAGGMSDDGLDALLVGLFIIACIISFLVGFILGLVALFQKGRKRTFAAIGVGLNATFVILVGILVWIGIAVE